MGVHFIWGWFCSSQAQDHTFKRCTLLHLSNAMSGKIFAQRKCLENPCSRSVGCIRAIRRTLNASDNSEFAAHVYALQWH